ncbi:MAG: non-heme iron oxygenase ferredoxin subunit [Ilumatobacteraceae bacterium]|nr:non-heme iron oxygenase ferredoxin subunit [Ilumatobacteraceae bacterium]
MKSTIVCALNEIESGNAMRVVVDKISVAVVRIGDEVYAIADTCSHAKVSLSDGIVLCDSKEIECIKHGSAFSLLTGEPSTLPATQAVTVFSARVENGNVLVETSN